MNKLTISTISSCGLVVALTALLRVVESIDELPPERESRAVVGAARRAPSDVTPKPEPPAVAPGLEVRAPATVRPPLRVRPESAAASAADPTLELVEGALAIDDPLERSDAVGELADRVDTSEIRDLLDALGPDGRAGEFGQSLLRRWAAHDPVEAAAWVKTLPDGGERAASLRQVSVVWASRDLKAASRFARDLPAGALRTVALESVGNEAVRTNPAEAWDLALHMTPGVRRDALAARAASEWAVIEPAGLVGWLEDATRDESSFSLSRIVASASPALAESEPRKAAELVLKHVAPGRARNDALASVMRSWSRKRPAEAARFRERVGEGARTKSR